MAVFVGIDLKRAVERFASLLKLVLIAVKLEQPQQGCTVIGFSVCGIELLGKKFQHFDRSPVTRHDVLHHGKEGPTLSFAPLKMLEFFGHDYGFTIELRIEECPNEISDLLNSRRILFEDLPDQGCGFGQAVCA